MTEKTNLEEQFVPGLEDVIVCKSSVSDVDGKNGVLTYRGYDIHELAESSTFEEVSYLLLMGELPNKSALEDFKVKLVRSRAVQPAVYKVLRDCPLNTHPMSLLRTAVSVIGSTDPKAEDTTLNNETEIALKLIAQLPTITAAIMRLKENKDPIPPNLKLNHSANFLFMMTGKEPTKLTERLMDMALILHADHEVPASTFSAMVVNSSMTDMYSAITAAIGSLKGPLHGGANETAIRNIQKIAKVENVKAYMEDVIANKKKVPGIGHRVYKTYDPRSNILKKYAKELAYEHGEAVLYDIAEELEKECVKIFAPKNLYPNVDFYSGIVYHVLGIPTDMFTPIFAVSRISGWTARLLEYLPTNRIFRPRALYTGSTGKRYVKIEERK